jgi:hypothetical protein
MQAPATAMDAGNIEIIATTAEINTLAETTTVVKMGHATTGAMTGVARVHVVTSHPAPVMVGNGDAIKNGPLAARFSAWSLG